MIDSGLQIIGNYATLYWCFLNKDETRHIIEDDLSQDELDALLGDAKEHGLVDGNVYINSECVISFDIENINPANTVPYIVGDGTYDILFMIESGEETYIPLSLTQEFMPEYFKLNYHIENLNEYEHHYLVPVYMERDFDMDINQVSSRSYFLSTNKGVLYEVEVD